MKDWRKMNRAGKEKDKGEGGKNKHGHRGRRSEGNRRVVVVGKGSNSRLIYKLRGRPIRPFQLVPKQCSNLV